MKIEIKEIRGIKIAELVSDKIVVKETQDALDIMAESNYLGSWKIILHENNISPDFFVLKTGLAGEILQKFSTYNVQLAIIGDFSKYPGKSLKDFIRESNRFGRINFVGSFEEATERLAK